MGSATTPSAAAAVRGAGAGLVATVAMSGLMLAAQKLGLLGRMPPRLLVDRTLSRFGFRRKTSRGGRVALTALAHLGFGATAGAIYGVGHDVLGRGRPPSLAGALAFAGAVWAVSYAGWIPALGLMRQPTRDRPGRQPSMIAAHAIYGAVLARALGALEPRPSRSFESFASFE